MCGIAAIVERDPARVTPEADLAGMVAAEAGPGDVVVLLGAGDITAWAYALPAQLEAL